jgi:ferrochelatase
MQTHRDIAILLFNLGGPDTLHAVEPFLVNLFSDREIIELPGGAALQPLFARLVARLRATSVRRNYASIGGGSPQLRITRAQAAALEARLNDAAGSDRARHRVLIAMRYSRPSAEDALHEIAAAGMTRLMTVTLFPHFSKATTGSSRREFERTLARPEWRRLAARLDINHVEHYADDPRYLDAMADTVRTAWQGIPVERRSSTVILFSAHGLPQRFIDQGDPYVRHITATRAGILERVGLPNRELLAYQSRTGPVRWLRPGTEETLVELAREGVENVLVVPLSFVSDHIETLYEVDMLFAGIARRAGVTGYYRTPALNTHPLFIDALAGLVGDRARVLGWTSGEVQRAAAAAGVA